MRKGGTAMKCQFCGTEYSDTLAGCPNCGTPANQSGTQPSEGIPGFQSQSTVNPEIPHTYTEKEFYNLPELEQCKSNIKSAAFFLYVCAVLNIFLCIISGNPFTMIDVLLIAIIAILLQVKKSRVSAVILLVYACFNSIVLLVQTGRSGGYLILVASIWAVNYTFKYQKAWKNYQETGVLPDYTVKRKTKKR